jgi:spore maturation protein CgeB
MRVLYAGIEAENYDPRRSPSFEQVNFLGALQRMPSVSVVVHPFDRILTMGKELWNEELLHLVRREQPDILFVFMYTDECDPVILDRIRTETDTKTVAWFADDYWRFWNYSRFYAPHFTLAVTTAPQAVGWYKDEKIDNAFLSQWAANPNAYWPVTTGAERDIDVSFIGQWKRPREKMIQMLRDAGIRVEAFGLGWPAGRISREAMMDIIGRSKIMLNLNDRPSRLDPWVLGRLFFMKSRNRIVPDLHLISNVQAWWHFAEPHIHARIFELAACRAFVVSGYTKGIERYYEPDREMVFCRTNAELVEKIRYYIDRPEERDRIASAAYERTLREHTYEERFRAILNELRIS